MKKRYSLIIIFVLLCQAFGSFFVFADTGSNKEQPIVCSRPSDRMELYLSFQNDMLLILSEGQANDRGYSVQGRAGLFTNEVLPLKTVSALDLVASSVRGSARSKTSSIITSIVLLLMAGSSTIQSGLDGIAILFKDRPIVRDYKELLDLETEFYDIAFFRSQQINLTRKMDANSKVLDDLNAKIKEYQSRGLLAEGRNVPRSISFSNIMVSLVAMNSSMKGFLSYGGSLGEYYSCLGDSNCKKETAVLKFSPDFIAQIKEDYKGTWEFGACSQYASYFKGTTEKMMFRKSDNAKSAWQDVKEARNRLKQTLFSKQRWSQVVSNPCDMTDYEMAQLKAYWGSEWKCGEGISVSSAISTTKEAWRNRKAIKESLKTKAKRVIQWINDVKSQWNASELAAMQSSSNTQSQGIYYLYKDFIRKKKELFSTSEKRQSRYLIFGSGVNYNLEYSDERYQSYVDIYGSIDTELYISQLNAMSADLSFELTKIKGLIDQVDAASDAIGNDSDKKGLKKQLKDVANYQCSN